MRRSLWIMWLLGAAMTSWAQPVPSGNSTATQPQGSPSETQQVAQESTALISPPLTYRRSVPTYTPKYDSSAEYDGSAYPSATCQGHAAGYYGNPHHECRIFHICQDDGRLETFDCPPYTKFNNYLLVCDWPFKVDYNCDPVHKEVDYPTKTYEPADKSYLPSFLSLYPAPKPLYTPAPYAPEKYPAVPVVPIYNAHVKSHQKSPYHLHEKSPHHYEEKQPYRKPDYKSYPDEPAYKVPSSLSSYEKDYAVEKAPVHVVYPVMKAAYPVENMAYDTSKLDYVPEKPLVYRSPKHHIDKAYKEAPPSKDEYSSYAPEKTVVIPLYPEHRYEPPNYAPVPYKGPEYKEEKPVYAEPKYPVPIYSEKVYEKPYPEKAYYAEKPVYPAIPYENKYPAVPIYEKVPDYKHHEYKQHTDSYPVHHEHKATIYEPKYAPEYPEKYAGPVYNYPGASSGEYMPEKMYDYKTFEKYGRYPTTVASYASALKSYNDYVDQHHEYAPSPYANYRSRLASIFKSY